MIHPESETAELNKRDLDAIDKLKSLEVLRKDLLEELQNQITDCIDEFIESLESK
ncbi:hypothetical protein [Pasteurella multocida]|uniref:hypothetical protein n=1 Tax=Pasteurella multocida TaxID=747 RepID=UPI003979AF8A